MEKFDNFLSSLFSLNVWAVAKLAYLLAILLYIIFSIVLVKQVNLMTRSLKGDLDRFLKIISKINLAVVILVFVIALLIL